MSPRFRYAVFSATAASIAAALATMPTDLIWLLPMFVFAMVLNGLVAISPEEPRP